MANQNAKNHVIGSKAIPVIIGLLIAALGIIFFIFPLGSVFFASIFIVVGLLIYGAFRIINFIMAPSGFRDGWQLAQGIIFVVCSIVILASDASNVIVSFAFMLSFLWLFSGINQIISSASLKGIPGSGLVLFSGIVNVLLAIFLICAPFMGVTILAMVQGVYLCVTGVAVIIEGFAKKPVEYFDKFIEAPKP